MSDGSGGPKQRVNPPYSTPSDDQDSEDSAQYPDPTAQPSQHGERHPQQYAAYREPYPSTEQPRPDAYPRYDSQERSSPSGQHRQYDPSGFHESHHTPTDQSRSGYYDRSHEPSPLSGYHDTRQEPQQSGYYESRQEPAQSGYYDNRQEPAQSGYYESRQERQQSGPYESRQDPHQSGPYDSRQESGYYQSGQHESGQHESGQHESGQHESGYYDSRRQHSGSYESRQEPVQSGYYESRQEPVQSGYYDSRQDVESGYYNYQDPSQQGYGQSSQGAHRTGLSTDQLSGKYSPVLGAMRVTLPSAGELIAGRYQIIDEIGIGGFGAVYRAHQRGLEKEVALKVMLPQASSIEGAAERFRREAMLAKELGHPNTITLYDFGTTDDGLTYIAMEFLDGITVEESIEALGPMTPARVTRVASQVLKSLAEAHARGIVHRDLKPANIMLVEVYGEKDFVKVLDFGIARAFENREQEFKTKTGTVIGTPQYIAPEQLKGLDVGPEADMYSLGLIMAEMLTGRVVYDYENANLIIMHQLSDPTSPIPEEVLAGPLGGVIQKATQKNPANRYHRAQEMLEAMNQPSAAAPSAEVPSLVKADTLRVRAKKKGGLRKHEPGMIIRTGAHGALTDDVEAQHLAQLQAGAAQKGSRLPLIIALLVVLLIGAAAAVVFIISSGESQTPAAPDPTEGLASDDQVAAAAQGTQTEVEELEPWSDAHIDAHIMAGAIGTKVWRRANIVIAALSESQSGEVRLMLITEPTGAYIYRNDERIGRTPFNDVVPSGDDDEALTVRRRGYLDTTLTVDLTRDAFPETVILTREPRHRERRSERDDDEHTAAADGQADESAGHGETQGEDRTPSEGADEEVAPAGDDEVPEGEGGAEGVEGEVPPAEQLPIIEVFD